MEVKRAVPKSETPSPVVSPKTVSSPAIQPVGAGRGSSAQSSNKSSPLLTSTTTGKQSPSIGNGSSTPTAIGSGLVSKGSGGSGGKSGKGNSSVGASGSSDDLKDEFAYNKVFVGGLHYDTRDGTN